MLNEKLQKLGFNSADYSLSGEELVALPQTRMIEQIIQHEAVLPTFDEQGVELTPEIPAWEEVIQVEETFYAELPSIDELKRLCVIDNDPAMLIGEFLKGKPVTDDDSLNVDLFMNGQGGWRFSQIDAPTWAELFSLIAPTKTAQEVEKAKQDKIEAGRKAREVCQKALDYIAGENLDKELTIEQITQLQSLMQAPEAALRAGRPTLAFALISQVQPDEILVSQELKDTVLSILENV